MAGRFKMHRSAARARGGTPPQTGCSTAARVRALTITVRRSHITSSPVSSLDAPGMVASTKLLACQDMTTRSRSSNRTTPAATGRSPRLCRVRALETSRRVKGARRSGPGTVRKVAKRARSGMPLSVARARAVATVLGTSRNSDVRPWPNEHPHWHRPPSNAAAKSRRALSADPAASPTNNCP